MGQFSDFLLTVDYDRTLTAPDSTIPQRNLDAISYFIRNGGAFTVNTGRSLPMYRSISTDIPVNAPLLLYNGSADWDPATGVFSNVHYIDIPMWETIEEVHALFPDLTLEIQNFEAHYTFWENPGWNRFYEHVGCAHATVPLGTDLGPFLKFTLYGEIQNGTVAGLYGGDEAELRRIDQVEAALTDRFGDKVAVFRAAPRIIDVHAKGVSKHRAARCLQRELGRKYLVCVGDAMNDLTMLEGADYPFCPGDSILKGRFPSVCPCGEGAIADVILKKIPAILEGNA